MGGHCTVYEERYERAPWCHSAEDAMAQGLLAQDCPYVRHEGVKGYKGKTTLKRSLREKVEPAICEDIINNGVPYGLSEKGIKAFLARFGIVNVELKHEIATGLIRIRKKD